MTEDKVENKTFAQKLAGLRKDVVEQDWKDDGKFSFGKGKDDRGYSYVSADKIKRNINSLFEKNGLELVLNFSELESRGSIGLMSQHWTVKLEATIMDLDNDRSITSTVYGEAADSGDKGIAKAHTYALKNWVCSTFMIADGTDPDNTFNGTSPSFNRTEAETEAVMSQILDKAVHVPPMPERPNETPKRPATPAPPVAPKVPSAAPDAPAKGEPKEVKLEEDEAFEMFPEVSPPKRKAIMKIADDYYKAKKDGQVSIEEFMSMSEALAKVKDDKSAVNFIIKYNRQ